MQNMQKSWTLHIIVYRKDARTPATTYATSQYGTKLQTTTDKRVRNTNHEQTEGEQADESVDAEAALYIKELHEYWANIKMIRPKHFLPRKNNLVNKETNGEFWVETTTQKDKLQWLADTGSPRSFLH